MTLEESLAQTRSEMASTWSHALKTPLTTIKLYSQLLLEQADDANEPLRDGLKIIDAENDKLTAMDGNLATPDTDEPQR